ncbi:uncharacterized protein LOC112163837 isoform X2 [Rosa chinensis]|uniref:uncharacterized protein LOC112163837 isoform X2 n=1 Tax=Rosa chinensis TaxID=74649 RepID=UPI001AD8D790|nr:uncharacterized protein LOC112163837 isoform X2 [Rosa chinensis]
MSTTEKHWLQIFEGKQWIINKAKQQAFLFDQDLASKLIIAGIAPPPSLFSSHPDVLNHHELISEVPLPRTRRVIPFTGSHCCGFDKPVATAHYGQLTNDLCTEHCGVKKVFDVGGNVLDLPPCPISNGGCASNGVTQHHREEDPSVTSPEDERDERVSDVYHDSALTPARGTGEEVSILPQGHISDAGCAFDGVLQYHKEENPGGTSPEDQGDTRMLDIYLNPALSLARVQRSKSRQRALAIRNSTQKSCSQDKGNVDGYAGETIKCLISTPQSENVDELNENHSEVEKPKIGEFQSKEKGSDIYSGRITRSRSSGHQENSLDVSGSPCIYKSSDGIAVDSIGTLTHLSNQVIHPLELVSYCHITNDGCREGELKLGDYSSKKRTVEKDSMCANLERDEHTPKALQEFKGPSISKDVAGNSIVCRSPVEETHLNEDHHMVNTSKSSPEAQKKEGEMGLEGVGSSPNALFTFLHEEKEASVFPFLIKQAAGHPQDSLLEETGVAHPTSTNIDEGSQCLKENPVSLLPDNLRLENAEDLSCAGKTMQAQRFDFGGPSKFLELSCGAPHVECSQSENVGELNDNHSEVEKQKIGEFQIKEEGTDIYSGRITRSRSSGHQENSLNASGSPCIGRTSSGIAVDIDTVEESCLKGLSTPASKKGMQGSSSVEMPLPFMHGEKKLEEGMSITTRENCNSSLEMDFLGNCEVSAKEMDVQSGLVEALEEEFSKSRRASHDNVISSVKESFDAYTDAVPKTLLESGRTPKQKCSMIDDQTPLRVDWDRLVCSPIKEVKGSNLSTANAAIPTELVSEDCAVDSNALCNPHKSTDVDFAMVSGPGSHRILDAEILEVENPYAAFRDELRSNLAQSTVNAHISPEYVQRSASDDREVGCSESTECQIAENSKGRSFWYSMEGTSPTLKRRKIDDKRVHDLSASVALREEVLHAVKKDSMCANLEREEHSPKALQKFQGRSISQEDDGKLIVSKSPVEETHLNENHMVERSESLPEAQKKEGGMGLEGEDSSPNAPFTFLHEEKEASVFSRLIKQAAGHPLDSLLEDTGVAVPTDINIDRGSQCLKEDPICLHLQDDLRVENVEDWPCAGRTMLAKRSDSGGTSNFKELSGGAPHVESLDLTSADEAMPVLERFVIKTDDEPCSIAEEGISFDEWNLPNTALERAGILEQLCKSACMQTPVAYSLASYKLHKVQNLQQSVPTGVLEHVDLRTTFPINDNVKQLKDGNSSWSEEVGPAFYGSSYSDCLPNFSGQSSWDIKKPYSSPVGNLWDRIASSSSSSGKRVSSIPELACISEENENTDEVADTFQDGIVSEVLDCSPKRPPLADITEIPNLPASVSEAAAYTDRFSLDSVTTEFSLTGTHKSVKKKPGIQNSSKRRYNNKENQSVSRKRATGSLQNRFSKPKFSGKTSLRKGGPSLSEVEPKRNNIVSNITSFIPLVQQKQAAAALPGKRDIKVKALEAAEAAKRLAERKDNERKMKKEAMKVERARVEQENLRKLELQRKRKQEERKKIEADMAAKKREREGEDKKEKQRKRMRVEEGRREQREHEDKLRAEKVKKEIQCQASDGRRCESKDSKCNTVHKKMDKEGEHDTLRSISETDPRSSCVSANNARSGTAVHEEKSFSNFDRKEESNLDKATENEKLVVQTSREQSYDISPYKESDDENDEDDDSIPNNKFIPSWASKNCLALVASRQSRTDPEVFFPPKSFPCVAEVLLL